MRQYHDTESNYRLPNDEAEHERLGLLNDVLKGLIGGNYLVPLHDINVRDVLDICCGSGHWATDMANEFPNTRIIGLDISRPSIEGSSVMFVQHDINNPLPFEDASFDFIQMRTVPSFPDRAELMVEIHRILRPGGFLAFIEPNESISRAHQKRTAALLEVDRLLNELPHMPRSMMTDADADADAVTSGNTPHLQYKSWSIARDIEYMIKTSKDRTGSFLFETSSVGAKSFWLPIGTWPQDPEHKEMGRKTAIVQMRLIDTLGDQFRRLPGFGDAEFDTLRRAVEEEVDDESLQLEMEFVYAWGRKM